jgi:hypothetical protein
MASYLPPTEDLPIFDNQVFTSNSTDALTYATAKKYFITYPSAQGTTTITDFIAGSIDYLSPSSGSFFNIGTNQVSGGTVRIGPTGGSSGVSVHCGNIDFKNNTINNATSGTTGNINLGDSQTSGVLNIGTGARVTSGNGGAINIGTNVGSSGPLNIGGTNISANSGSNVVSASNVSLNGSKLWSNWTSDASIRTGGTLTLTSANSANVNIATESFSDVTIGASGTSKNLTIYNILQVVQGLTLASGKYITTSHSGTVTAPTSSQVGGVINGTDITSPTFPSTGNITSWASITLPAGSWVITGTRRYDSSANSTRILWSLGTTLRNNASSPDTSDNTYGVTSCVLNSTNNFVTITGSASLTVETIVYFNIYSQYSTAPSISTVNSSLRAIRIA